MKISFNTEGGFGYFPGLNKSFEINSESLPKEEAEKLENLISEITASSSSIKTTELTTGADLKKYKIIVENNNLYFTINASDKDINLKVKSLISYLRKKQNESHSK